MTHPTEKHIDPHPSPHPPPPDGHGTGPCGGADLRDEAVEDGDLEGRTGIAGGPAGEGHGEGGKVGKGGQRGAAWVWARGRGSRMGETERAHHSEEKMTEGNCSVSPSMVEGQKEAKRGQRLETLLNSSLSGGRPEGEGGF